MSQEPRKRMTLLFNALTREIKTVEVGTTSEPPWFNISLLANKSCGKCYGDGHCGFNVRTKWMEPCPCTQKNMVDKLVKIRMDNKLFEVPLRQTIKIDDFSR